MKRDGADIGLLRHISHTIKKDPRLIVCIPGGESGVLVKESNYVFSYGMEAVHADHEVAIGLPYRVKIYHSGDLFGIFSMNEPEGYLRYYIEDAMSRIGIPNKLLLLFLTQGLQLGRVSYRHDALTLPDTPAENMGTLLGERAESYFEHLLARYAPRSGLSGAQPKVLVPVAAGNEISGTDSWSKGAVYTPSFIVKNAGAEFPGLSLNEFFCMSVARRAGLNVPGFWLSEDSQRLVVERFDRDGAGHAIGFEDMAVLGDVTAAQKYQGSYEAIMRATQVYCDEPESAREAMFACVMPWVSCQAGRYRLPWKGERSSSRKPVRGRMTGARRCVPLPPRCEKALTDHSGRWIAKKLWLFLRPDDDRA